jgi:hypothetical protein
MLDLHGSAIEAFVSSSLTRFVTAFPSASATEREVLERACREALETLLTCDCAYHDLHHTMLATDCGQVTLRGRMLSEGDISASDWLHAVVAMLYHDIGYIRGVLRDDREGSYLVDELGNRIVAPPGATDAFLTPHHVTRSCLYVHERFADDPYLNTERLASHIEMTRFPVPEDPYYQADDSVSALVRAADLIGQMGDPQYLRKLARLFAEFREIRDTTRQNYTSAGDLRDKFPNFFYDQVYPYLGPALRYLSKTREGQQWMANLFHHARGEVGSDNLFGPERTPQPSPMAAAKATAQEPRAKITPIKPPGAPL